LARVIQDTPEKVVIVAGPAFGEALKFTLFGALLGAAFVHFMGKEQTPSLAGHDAVLEGISAGGHKPTAGSTGKALASLAARARSVSGRALELAHSATEALKPALEQAVAQGKLAAAEIEAKLKKDVENAGDRPSLAEEDNANMAGSPDKYVE